MARADEGPADHVVVGAGAAGCVVAARLSEDPDRRVVLLEAGGRARKLAVRIPAGFNQLFRSELDWSYDTEPEERLDDRRLYWPRGKGLGGSTIMNAQMWVRGSRLDYDGWAAAAGSGWAWDEVLPVFRSIERSGRGSAPWRGTDGPLSVNDLRSTNPMTHDFVRAATAAGIARTRDVNDPDHHEGVDFTQVLQKGGRRCSAADAYLGPARRRSNLTVRTGAHATRVVMDDGRAVGVAYLQGGVEHVVRAERGVVLCGGAVNTPQLLMCSGIGPADHLRERDIDCVVDRPGVGANLQDHLCAIAISLSAAGVTSSLVAAQSPRQLANWVARGKGMLSSNVGEALAFVRTAPEAPAPDIELIFAPVPFIDHGLVDPPGHGISIGAVLLQPESRGTIRLAADPTGPPVISPQYLSDPAGKDLATLVRGMRLAYDVLHQPALARYVDRDLEPAADPGTDDGWRAFIQEQAETLYHPVGTARMGPSDDPTSVVDGELRVLGVEGLRVADASVMPTITRGHTQAPTMLIGERAAALIPRVLMERLSGLDASFLYNETPSLHMHTLKYAVLDVRSVEAGFSLERLRSELGDRLHLLPQFRRRVVEVPLGLHHPVWVEDIGFRLEDHVRSVPVPAPGGRREMDEVIGRLASTPLDRSRPLWECWVLEGLAADLDDPEGAPADGSYVGFLVKMHHALADGVAAAALLANVMDPDPGAELLPPAQPWRPDPVPSRWELVKAALRDGVAGIGRLPALVARTARGVRAVVRRRRHAEVSPPLPIIDAPRSHFNGALTPRRAFASAELDLGAVKAVRGAFGVSVNDVVLGIVAGSLRHHLVATGGLPDKSLMASIPVAADPASARLTGNRVSNLFTSLRTDLDDPIERLQAIHEVTGAAKEVQGLLGIEMMADWIAYTPPRPYAWTMRQYSRMRLAERHAPPINVIVSNVPGPREPLHIAGATLDGIWSVGPILEGVGLNVTVWSYLDRIHVGVLGCADHWDDLHVVTDGMAASLDELVARAGVRP